MPFALSNDRCLLLDGPTGTELIARGFPEHPVLWTALAATDQPDLLRAVHRDYLTAGAEVLTANTFRTSAYSLGWAGLPGPAAQGLSLTLASVALAREAAAGAAARVWVAGSLAPLEDCYRPDRCPEAAVLEQVHGQTAAWLVRAGCDLILCETMGTAREATIAVRAARAAGAEVLVSFITDEQGAHLLSGEPLLPAAEAGVAAGAAAVLINCVHAEAIEQALHLLQPLRAAGVPLGAYANAARMRVVSGGLFWEPDPLPVALQARRYAETARRWVEDLGVRILGSCCGTTPAHTRALRQALAAGQP